MLNRVQYGHDPRAKRFALAIGSQSIGVWELGSGDEFEALSPVPRPASRVPALTVSTPSAALRALAFIAPTVLLSIHESGEFAGWRIADEAGKLLAKAELLWEFRLAAKPCISETYGDYSSANFRIALGTKSGALLLVIPQGAAKPEVVTSGDAHRNDVTALSFSPDGARLALAGRDREIRLWDTRQFGAPDKSDTESSALTLRMAQLLSGSEAWPLCLAFSHAGDRLVSGGMDHDLNLWQVGAAPEDARLAGVIEHQGWVVDVAWSADDAVIATASWDNSVGIFEAEGLDKRATLRGHKDYVSKVYFPPNSDALISGSYDGHINRWNWQEATLEASHKAHSDWLLGLYPVDATQVISVSGDRCAALWSVPALQNLASLESNPLGGFFAEEAFGLNGYSEARLEPDPAGESAFEADDANDANDADGLPDASSALDSPSSAQETDATDIRADLGEVLASGGQLDAEDNQALFDFFDEAPTDLGLGRVASTSEVSDASEVLEDAAEIEGVEDSQPFDTLKMPSVAIDTTAAEDRAHALESKRPGRKVLSASPRSLKSRLKKRLSQELPEAATPAEASAADRVKGKTLPIFLGSLGAQSEDEQRKTQILPAVGLEFSSDVFEAFGEVMEQAPQSAPVLEQTEAPVLEKSAAPVQDFSDDLEVDFDLGNTTRVGMPSEASYSPESAQPGEAIGFKTESKSIAHSLDSRSGTLTNAHPIGVGGGVPLAEAPANIAPAADEKNDRQETPASTRSPGMQMAPLSEIKRLDEETAPHTSGLSQEFETPSRVGFGMDEDHQDATSQIDGHDLAMLRSGRLFAGRPQRFSAGHRGVADLAVPELLEDATSPKSEDGEVIETDFADIWERRWTPTAPGMGIIKRSATATQHYQRVSEFQSPHARVKSLALDTKRKLIASCGGDGTVVIWKFEGDEMHRFALPDAQLNAVIFVAGATLIYAGDEAGVLHGWALPQKTLGTSGVLRHAQQKAHESGISSLAVSSDEKFVVSGGFDAQARVWSTEDGGAFRVLEGHETAVIAVGFAHNSIITTGDDGSIKRWTSAAKPGEIAPAGEKIRAMATHSGGGVWASQAGRVWARDARTDEMIELLGHQGDVTALAASRPGEPVVAGADGSVHVYARGYTRPFQSFERSEEHTSELQSRPHLVCRLLLEKKNIQITKIAV